VDLAVLEKEQRRRWREQARARAAELKERRARVIAYHEAGHALVGAFLGLVPEQIGLEVGTRFDAGAVVAPAVPFASPTQQAIVLSAGGLSEARATGIAARGTGSDEAQIAGLDLRPRAETAARTRAARLVDELWPFVEALVPVLLEYRHLSGETAIFMALQAVFGVQEAARRAELRPLRRAFELPESEGGRITTRA